MSLEQQRQQRLVSAVFSMEKDLGQEHSYGQGLSVYQRNLALTAARSLTISYPVMSQLIGEEALRYLARELLTQELPRSGDWADWGAGLAVLLGESPLADSYPYLADVARLEWLLHRAARAAVPPIDGESFSLLAEQSLAQLRVELSPALGWMASEHPIGDIWSAHTQEDVVYSPGASGRHWVVYQQLGMPALRGITRDEYLWLVALRAGQTLQQVFGRVPSQEFGTWLANAIENALIHRVTPLPIESGEIVQ